ncbi:MAG: U32 family peptidase [Eubacterium sp.]|nr:U32 family peptidase [Eubacterium sp.]
MKFEILAPCGSAESLTAAVRCGANAVYLGTKNFNARRNADNFDFDALEKAVNYCHERNVKVYITLNTLVSDGELKSAYSTVEECMKAGVDAFIIQDTGLSKMIKECFPEARLHASTQCSVNTPDGFRALEKLGFSRAVLPREMSESEIKEIRSATDMELEIFVHGALCMCVSGQCYLSSMLGGRSGNRGLCAQPCRLSFSADNSGSFDLSLKDLSLISRLKEIESAGVFSLKIEGRMKRPEYVAAAVTACKKAIEGTYGASEEKILKNVFSRSGFTDGYFTGERKNMFGTRQKEDVLAASDVLKELSRLYEKETALIPLDMKFTCKANQPAVLTVKSSKKSVTLTSCVPEKAINAPLTEDGLRARLSKLGGTPYYLKEFSAELDDGLILPASVINEMRRSAVTKLGESKKAEFTQHDFSLPAIKKEKPKPYYTARFLSAGQIPEEHPFKRIFIPLSSKNSDFISKNAGAEIPRGLFGCEEKLKKRLAELKEIGVKNVLAGNLGAYKTAEAMGFNVFGDFGLNVYNSLSAQCVNSPVLSFELTLRQANEINAADTGIIAYGKLPVMLTRNCPVKNNIGCEKCGKHGTLTDRKGYSFPVKCSDYPCVEILNPVPLVLSGIKDEIKTDFLHFYFTDESKEEISKIAEMYKNNKNTFDRFTRGLYLKGVK